MKHILLAFLASLAFLPALAQVTTDGTKTGIHTGTIGAVAWASRPSCSPALTGYTARISDVGPAPGIRVMCDGTRWLPDGPQMLARSGVAVSVTGTTAETALATVTVPAGLLGVNGGLLVYSTWSYTNSANNKTPRVRFGGIGGTQYMNNVLTTSTSMHDLRRIRNRSAANTQIGGSSVTGAVAGATSASGSAAVTSALDTTAPQDLVFTGQLGLGTETMALENYEVWVTP